MRMQAQQNLQAQHMQARQAQACRSSLTVSGNLCGILWPMHPLPPVVHPLQRQQRQSELVDTMADLARPYSGQAAADLSSMRPC